MTLEHSGVSGTFYRTGDLAKRDEDGMLHFHGRNDNQVQIYGNRVELGEVENTIYKKTFVKNAAVLDFKHDKQHWLVAFVELSKGHENITGSEIREFITSRLPSYMVPNKVLIVPEIPLNHAGKIDKMRLKERYESEFKPVSTSSALTQTEQILTDIWNEVLKESSIDIDKDFFSLGGDSILALGVLYKLRRHFPEVPKAITLFRKRTIREFAAAIDELNADRLTNDKNIIISAEKHFENKNPLSLQQKGFWFAQKLNPDASPNWVASMPVKGKMNIAVLQGSLNYLIERHPMLRTVFIEDGMNTSQQVFTKYFQKIVYIDISGVKRDEQDKIPEQAFKEFSNMVFDLSELPLFRLKVFRLSDESSALVMCIHHIIGDAWSLKILASELLEVYDHFIDFNNYKALPPVKNTYNKIIDYQTKQADMFNDKIHNFWENRMSDLPVLNFIDNDNGVHAKKEVSLLLQETVKNKLKDFCTDEGISLFSLFLTIYARSLGKICNACDLLIGTSLSGRDLPIDDIDKIVGCFAKSIPLRLTLSRTRSSEDLNTVNSEFLDAVENSEISPSGLIKILSRNGSDSVFSYYRFFFSYIDFSSFDSHAGKHISIKWDEAQFHFHAETVESDLLMGIMVSDAIKINFHGRTGSSFRERFKIIFIEEMEAFLQNKDSEKSDKILNNDLSIDAALIAYFPSSSNISNIIPSSVSSALLKDKFIETVLPDNEPRLLEIETTRLGKTGMVFLPLTADDIISVSKTRLIHEIYKAIKVCKSHGAAYISLAGNLPARTNYCFSIIEKLNEDTSAKKTVITTGHSCTAVAIIKNIEKVIQELELDLAGLKIVVVGYGSIGQASLSLLLSKFTHPSSIIITDLAGQMKFLERAFTRLRTIFSGEIQIEPIVDGKIPEDIYSADIIIGASSQGGILDSDKLLPGTILADDSFPSITDNKKAIARMKEEKDILVIGAGKMSAGEKTRKLIETGIPGSIVNKAIRNIGDEGLPGCRIESLLMSYDNTLTATIGLVNNNLALQYWEKADSYNLTAVRFHLEGYNIEPEVIFNVKRINSKKRKNSS